METTQHEKMTEDAICEETKVVFSEKVLIQKVFETIREFKVTDPFGLEQDRPGIYALNMWEDKDVIKDLSKIDLPEYVKFVVCTFSNGSKSKRYNSIINSIGRDHVAKFQLYCNSSDGSIIKHSVIRSALRYLQNDKIDLYIEGMHITERTFIKLMKKCCRISQLAFLRCSFDNIESNCNLGRNPSLKVILINGCSDSSGTNINESSVLESLIKFIAETSLKYSMKELRFSHSIKKTIAITLRETYSLPSLDFTCFDKSKFSFTSVI
ncbi:unnamed protein product [Moneuplotes crassus]|uniref:Uncharacterized protein n=1 Tax=Euplotes crassus TaxID=5936 RepID=A0AAD2D0U4_EUPCR|nr:unnamed protein product [Moneuplotes crassus]